MTTTTQRDFYEILGVPREATTQEMRKAYLKLAHRYHPDKTGGNKAAEDKLKQINEAYDTLKNPEKRRQYDQTVSGAAAFGSSDFAGEPEVGSFHFSGDTGFGSAFEDLFGSSFGGAARRATAQTGNDIEVNVMVSLKEVLDGTRRTLKVPRREACAECQGRGHARGHEPEVCAACHGTGQVQQARGAFTLSATCTRCRGKGRIIIHPCPRCAGSGYARTERELAVTIPPGVHADTRLRLAGEGEPGMHGGPRGDLFVRVTVEDDPVFTRQGHDLVCEVPVPFTQAALGAKVRVPTLNGAAELTVPEGTQDGALLRMRGLGLPRLGNASVRGDAIVRIRVEVPVRLSKRQRELMEAFATASTSHNYPKQHRFADLLKDLWRK
jgi:molecular chaperone DnaJ